MKYDPNKRYHPDDVLEFDSEAAYEEAIKAKAQEFSDDVDRIVTQSILTGKTVTEIIDAELLKGRTD